MIVSQTDVILSIPRIILGCFIGIHIKFHITGKELIGSNKRFYFFRISGNIHTRINKSKIHTQTKSIGKTNPLGYILIEQQIRTSHCRLPKLFFSFFHFCQNTFIYGLAAIPFRHWIFTTHQSFTVRSLIHIIH